MENTNFNLKIKRLPYSRLLKSEMADYVEKTINIVGRHDLQSVLIDPLFQQLSVKKPDIQLLRLNYGIDTERLRLSKLKAKMMLTISAFKLKARLVSKSKPELDMHAIQNAINKHLRYLDKCKNDKELSQKIAGFFDLVESNEAFEATLDEFGLTNELDEMQSIFNTMEEVSKNRVRLLSQRPEFSTKAIVKGMAEAVDNLFQSIEVANILSVVGEAPEEGDPIELAPLMDELNQLSEMYSRSISIRAANNKRKNKKEGDEENEEDTGDDTGDENEGGEPMTTAMCFGNDGDVDESSFEGTGSPVDERDEEEHEEDHEDDDAEV